MSTAPIVGRVNRNIITLNLLKLQNKLLILCVINLKAYKFLFKISHLNHSMKNMPQKYSQVPLRFLQALFH